MTLNTNMVFMKAFDAKFYFCVLHTEAVVCNAHKSVVRWMFQRITTTENLNVFTRQKHSCQDNYILLTLIYTQRYLINYEFRQIQRGFLYLCIQNLPLVEMNDLSSRFSMVKICVSILAKLIFDIIFCLWRYRNHLLIAWRHDSIMQKIVVVWA